jgi:hypothetical protein
MGQIEVRRPYAGERIKHSQGFGQLLHHVMTFEDAPYSSGIRRLTEVR